MTTPKRLTLATLALAAGLVVLFGFNLFWGSVALSPRAVAAALLGKGAVPEDLGEAAGPERLRDLLRALEPVSRNKM